MRRAISKTSGLKFDRLTMKILEAQSAVLSNYEVYQHLADQKYRYKQGKHRGPSNLEMVVRDVRTLDVPSHSGTSVC